MNYRKKLIEVALPLEKINEESSLRKRKAPGGYPTTLHKWWAQRPLAACRAVLFASLVDDPDSDPTFRKANGSVDEERAGYRRAELFNLIEELVLWENSNNESVLNRARAEIAASVASRRIHDTKEWTKDKIVSGEKAWAFVCRTAKPANVNTFLAEHAPPILDPFCGGGSIPLEAQRLGLRAFGSDLNPVPVLITKAMIEFSPRFAGKAPVNPEANARLTDGWTGAQGLAEDVRFYGKAVCDQIASTLSHLYPAASITKKAIADREDLRSLLGRDVPVVAWLWARTIPSPNPTANGKHVPLVSSFRLSTKKGKQAWIEPIVRKQDNSYEFIVHVGVPTADKWKVAGAGTKLGRGASFRCLLTDAPLDKEY
jgi:putative DNA methylase